MEKEKKIQDYDILIEETLSRVVTIQAKSSGEAEMIAQEKYDSSEIELNARDLVDITIKEWETE